MKHGSRGANVSLHFEGRLTRAHGNLFSLLRFVFGALTPWVLGLQRRARWISFLALAGLLMPIGILSEIYFGLSSVLVVVGTVSILVTTAVFALELDRMVVDGSISLKLNGMAKMFEVEFTHS